MRAHCFVSVLIAPPVREQKVHKTPNFREGFDKKRVTKSMLDNYIALVEATSMLAHNSGKGS